MPFSLRVMRAALSGMVYLTLFLCMIVLLVVGPRIETLLYPVVPYFEITDSFSLEEESETRYFISGSMIKLRGECKPIDISLWAGGGTADPNSKSITIDFNPDLFHIDKLRTRPTGSQHWGPWEVFSPEEPVGPILTLMVVHDCHFIWNTPAVIFTGLTTELFPNIKLDQ